MVIENLYIQTSLMVALSLFRGKEGGGGLFINQRWTLYVYIQIRRFGGAGEYENM